MWISWLISAAYSVVGAAGVDKSVVDSADIPEVDGWIASSTWFPFGICQQIIYVLIFLKIILFIAN